MMCRMSTPMWTFRMRFWRRSRVCAVSPPPAAGKALGVLLHANGHPAFEISAWQATPDADKYCKFVHNKRLIDPADLCMTLILGIDPGSRKTGFGVINYVSGRSEYVTSGVMTTAGGGPAGATGGDICQRHRTGRVRWPAGTGDREGSGQESGFRTSSWGRRAARP